MNLWFFSPFFLFIAVWIGIMQLIAILSGWKKLAARFPAGEPLEGERFRWVSGRLDGHSRYNNCINVTVSEIGIELSMVFFFRFAHPPLFIPWEAIESLKNSKGWIAVTSQMKLRDEDIQLTLFGEKLAASIDKRRNNPYVPRQAEPRPRQMQTHPEPSEPQTGAIEEVSRFPWGVVIGLLVTGAAAALVVSVLGR